jgi:ABC-2 type transport system ATP-binding protein
MTAIDARGLGKRYGSRWVLEDCTVEVPHGAVVALVGPNGAGKTTLLHLAAGLLRADAGQVQVLGGDPARDLSLLPRIGLVAQDMPLYRSLSVRDTVELGRRLNDRWDGTRVNERLEQLGIDPAQKVGTLSGGQRAQVALLIALGKRPELLLLDEPLAALDPLARRELLQTLMDTAAEGDLTIVLSSHLIVDLERICDHLVLVAAGRLRISGEVESIVEDHRTLVGPRPTGRIPGVAEVVESIGDGAHVSMVVRTDGPLLDPRWDEAPVTLEDVVLAYLAQSESRPTRPRPSVVDAGRAAS